MGRPDMQRICSFLQGYKAAMTTTDVTEVYMIIRQHRLDWQHVHNRILAHRVVWEALLELRPPGVVQLVPLFLGHMPLEAVVRNLGRITSLSLFTEEERRGDVVIQRLRNITTLDEGDLEDETEENGREKAYVIHPFRVLLAYEAYRGGTGELGCSKWISNKCIVDALEEAFHKSFQRMTPTGKKYCLAIDVGCFHLSDEYSRLDISANDDLKNITKKMQNVGYYAGIDCSLPRVKAMEQKIREYDVFCSYTCSDTYCRKVHTDEALRQYRDYSGNSNVKLVICAMNSKGFSVADPQDDGRMMLALMQPLQNLSQIFVGIETYLDQSSYAHE